MSPGDFMNLVEEYRFPIEEFASRRDIDMGLLQNGHFKVSTWMHPELNAMTLELRAFLLTAQNHETNIVYPSDWWQAFKERWFPAWMKKRWPVKRTRHHLTAVDLLPNHRWPELARKEAFYRVPILLETKGKD